MVSDFITRIDKFIRWSFYLLFFLVPLIMWPDTYELFEFNKMWFVFGVSLLIAFLWGAKMVLQSRIEIRRTPLDIPIALFLVSQIISTIISIDPHVSFWGYYSRFNGGLLSTISYIFLYYAFATNLANRGTVSGNDARIGKGLRLTSPNDETGFLTDKRKPISYSLLIISLLSGLAVTLWGLPGHFGVDPTCFVFRGTFDVSCWTDQFQPMVRIFSTLGQPNWMGTYLAALIPIALGFGFYKLRERKNRLLVTCYMSLVFLFFLGLLYTRSQSSFLGLIVGLLIFFAILIFKNFKSLKENFAKNNLSKYIVASLVIFGLTSFIIGTPIESLNKFTTLQGIQSLINHPISNIQYLTSKQEGLESSTNIQLGGTESSKIRLIVWQGAIEIFKRHPLFGSGVETYAYAYYNVKPLAHNLTSEWDYLYNKAHNEYLNYLATTGAFGLLMYLSIIVLFFFCVFKHFSKHQSQYFPVSLGIVGGYAAILVSNFFGFSVVVVNLFFFLFPILFFDLEDNKTLKHVFAIPKTSEENLTAKVVPPQTIIIVVVGLTALYYEFFLFNFWNADKKYALGNNLDKASEYVQAYTPLSEAVKMLPSEDLYKDELSINMATLSLLLAEQKNATQAAQFGEQAKALSDAITSAHPNNIVFLKTRARVAFALSEIDPANMDLAIETIEQARKLAPTDAKLVYNEGLFYEQQGKTERATHFINEAIKLKPNYIDAYYTLALYYSQLAKKGDAKSIEYADMARAALVYILKNIDPNHKGAKELLKSL